MADNKRMLTGEILDEHFRITMQEICEACQIQNELFAKLLEHHIIEPLSQEKDLFDLHALERTRIALRLHRDLQVNFEGLGVILDLLEEMQNLRRELDFWRRIRDDDES